VTPELAGSVALEDALECAAPPSPLPEDVLEDAMPPAPEASSEHPRRSAKPLRKTRARTRGDDSGATTPW